MSYKLYPWLKNFYNKIIYSNIFVNKNFGLLINYDCYLGVNILVINIIKWLFCNYKYNNKFCNNCLNCNLLNKNNHPNFFYLNFKKNIKFVDILNINDKFYNNLYISNYKVIYFLNFKFNNKYINNFLLKILEESYYKVIIIFTYLSSFKIPLTILSRCYKFKLKTPSESYILNFILNYKNLYINFNKNQIISSIRLSNYSPILSIFFLNKLWYFRKKFIDNIDILLSSNINDVFNLLNNNNFIVYNLYWLYYFFLDILKYFKNNVNFIYNIDYLYKIKYFKNLINYNKIFLILDKILLFYNDFNNFININKKILIFKIVYDIFYILNFK